MSTILVTGATGTLGTPTVTQLRAAGHEVRALSRKSAAGLTTGDLLTGEGLADAMAGVDTVIHLSTGKHDVAQARAIIGASGLSGIAHFILISIVGIEDIPLGYYKNKVEIERLLVESRLPRAGSPTSAGPSSVRPSTSARPGNGHPEPAARYGRSGRSGRSGYRARAWRATPQATTSYRGRPTVRAPSTSTWPRSTARPRSSY